MIGEGQKTILASLEDNLNGFFPGELCLLKSSWRIHVGEASLHWGFVLVSSPWRTSIHGRLFCVKPPVWKVTDGQEEVVLSAVRVLLKYHEATALHTNIMHSNRQMTT